MRAESRPAAVAAASFSGAAARPLRPAGAPVSRSRGRRSGVLHRAKTPCKSPHLRAFPLGNLSKNPVNLSEFIELFSIVQECFVSISLPGSGPMIPAPSNPDCAERGASCGRPPWRRPAVSRAKTASRAGEWYTTAESALAGKCAIPGGRTHRRADDEWRPPLIRQAHREPASRIAGGVVHRLPRRPRRRSAGPWCRPWRRPARRFSG